MAFYTVVCCLALPPYSWGSRKDTPMYDRCLEMLSYIISLGSLYLQPLNVTPTSAPLFWRTSLWCPLLPKDQSFRRSALGKKTKDDGLAHTRGLSASMLMGPFTSPNVISAASPVGVLASLSTKKGSLGSGYLNLLEFSYFV